MISFSHGLLAVKTYDWDSESHAVEGQRGEGHDNNDNPVTVNKLREEAAASLDVP